MLWIPRLRGDILPEPNLFRSFEHPIQFLYGIP